MAMAEGNEVPSSRRMPVPDSKSAPISSGIFARRLKFVGDDGGRVDLAALDAERPARGADDHAADVVFLDLVQQLFVFGAFGGGEDAEVIDHQHLAELLAQGHFLEGLFDPGGLRRRLGGFWSRGVFCARAEGVMRRSSASDERPSLRIARDSGPS